MCFVNITKNMNRNCGIQLISNGRLHLNILGVYLPFHDGSAEQIELYGETLECLQSVLELHQGEPLMIVGDMNAALPQQQSLARHGHRQKPFNAHSVTF
jgi:exonuclease III